HIIDFDGEDLMMSRDRCPYCSSQISHPIHFRISSAFTNRILSDIILDETSPLKNQNTTTLYNGKKYISFTDSRQGTAKISAMINIDSESNWIRYQVYHYLAKKMLDNRDPRSNEQLQEEKLYLEKQLKSAPPFLRKEFESKIEIINQILSSGNNDLREQSRATWQEIIDHIILSSDFKTLFYKI